MKPQEEAPASVHESLGSVPFLTSAQVPFAAPVRTWLHAWQVPVQAVLQQTLLTQKVEAQSAPVAQLWPSAPPVATQKLFWQVCPVPHLLPQEPQLLESLVVLTSQPSAALTLQSANPGLHEPMPQTPALQIGVPLLAVHAWLQEPQLPMSELVLTHTPLQAV